MAGISKVIRGIAGRLYNYTRKLERSRIDKQFGSIGKYCDIVPNKNLVYKNMYLEDHVIIQNDVNFISNKGRLYVKKYSAISSGCILIPGMHVLEVGVPFWLTAKKHIADEERDIHIAEDCWIGAGAIILPGINVGRGCVVGAGSVVTKDVPDYAVVAGCPARIIASKFSVDEIIEHERSLYPEKDRFSYDYLCNLFETFFTDLKSIGRSDYMTNHSEYLCLSKNYFEIIDYTR